MVLNQIRLIHSAGVKHGTTLKHEKYTKYQCTTKHCKWCKFCPGQRMFNIENTCRQESPPAWTQEACSPPACCSGWGYPPSWHWMRVPHPVLTEGVTPSSPDRGYPYTVLTGTVSPSSPNGGVQPSSPSIWGSTPILSWWRSTPIQSWQGVPHPVLTGVPHLVLMGGTPIQPWHRGTLGYPTSQMGYPSHWPDWVPPHPRLARHFDPSVNFKNGMIPLIIGKKKFLPKIFLGLLNGK